MTAPATSYGLPLGNGTTRSSGWWAMVWIIVTEASLFAFFLFSYLYLASQSTGPWPADGPLSLSLALPDTGILMLSSMTYMWAERGIRVGNQTRLRVGLLVTFLLGLAFAAIQALEWTEQPFTAQSHAFGSLFYTITGFHGAHVIVGLLLNLVVQIWAWRGIFTADRHLAVTNAGMYWHFVDIVWLFVFTTLYLSPRWA
jgi:heme/copper-type cytochrome/quinol oxidase subunit 3